MSNPPTFADRSSGRFFIKMHGLQNHFVITDARQRGYRPDVEDIIRICDVRVGIGADQLVVMEPPTAAGTAQGALAFMRLFNVDGREVEACGNATRCVAWLLLEEHELDSLRLETLAGTIACDRAGKQQVRCDMGRVSTRWQDVPMAEERDTVNLDLGLPLLGNAVALNIGNPHLVYFVADAAAVDIEALAPAIQKDPLFPDEVNVGIAQLTSEDALILSVYERGAGLTTACGSGACVAVFAAGLRGLTDRKSMRVTMPAGDVSIEILENSHAVMTGPVAYCFSGFY